MFRTKLEHHRNRAGATSPLRPLTRITRAVGKMLNRMPNYRAPRGVCGAFQSAIHIKCANICLKKAYARSDIISCHPLWGDAFTCTADYRTGVPAGVESFRSWWGHTMSLVTLLNCISGIFCTRNHRIRQRQGKL